MDDPDSASLEANMEDHVTALLGPMGRLLRRLRSFEASQHSLPEGLSANEIRLLQEGLNELYTYIKDVPEAKDPNFTPKWWIKEVRELGYDTEDYFDEVTQSGADANAGVRRSARLSTNFRIISKRKRRTQTGKDFSKLMARVDDARKRCESFQLAPETIRPDSGQAGVSCLTPNLALELPVSAAPISVHEQVGVEEPMNKLVELLALDEEQKKLKVTPIFGLAGVGKTTVARTLYYKYGGKFQCGAFVRVSRNPDIRRILTSMISQIKAPRAHAFSDAQDLIDSIIKHLEGKRYFIIIDDLWTESVWDIIRRVFPYGDCSSRIITTTQIEDVALACCGYQSEYIFAMRPLSYSESRKLFFNRVFGSEGEGGCPKDFEEIADGVIRKCGGLPLSIINVASLLQTKPNLVMEQWENVRRSLPFTLRTNPTSEGMKDVLILIYNKLPLRLKTCLLYLSMYPEGCTVRKDDLVKQWVVEGFVGGTEHVARGYFDELVRRGMIQPVDTNYSGEVLSCTVNHMVLDLIRYKSMEDNFIIPVDYFESTPGLPDKVRRLSVQFGGAKSAKIPESIRMSQVRSLLFCGFFKCLPSIVDYRLLRVLTLHIWADQYKESFDLTIIGELFHLKYLKIQCNITVKLPAKIRKLPHLGTLQVDAGLSAVPSDIGQLEKLLHLRLPGEANFRDLGELTNLQDLEITCCTLQGADIQENKMKCLASILGKLSSLKCLAVVQASGSSHVNAPQDDAGVSSMSISSDAFSVVSPPPELLQRLELSRRCCMLSSLPKWIQKNNNLCILKIAVRELSKEDIDILKELPALTSLSLYIKTAPADSLVIEGKEGFPVLAYFKFMCTAPCLSFMEGAMPNVRKLKLGFSAPPMDQHSIALISIEHLSGLKEISAKIWGAGADAESILTTAVRNHSGNPKINLVNWKFYGHEGTGVTTKQNVQRTLEQQGEIQEKDADRSGRNQNDDNVIPMPLESSSSLPISGTSIEKNEEGNLTPEEQHEIVEEDPDEYYRTQDEGSGGDEKKQASSRTSTLPESSSPLPAQEMEKIFLEEKEIKPKVESKPSVVTDIAMVSATTGAMNSVLRKLADLMGHEYLKLRGKQEEFMRLKEELGSMSALLEQVADMPVLNMEMKVLRNQMRDMTYDVEDCIDGLMLQFDEDNNTEHGFVADDTEYLKRLQDFIDQIQNLTAAQVWEANIPSMIENIQVGTSESSYAATELPLLTGHDKALGPVGTDSPCDELIKHIISGEQKEVKVICILGPGGLGKTTLANVVYREIIGQFSCGAFISVSPDVRISGEIQSRLHQPDNCDPVEYLGRKRYLFVFDGVQSAEEWEVIKGAMPVIDLGSRIIITTRIRALAESCHSSGGIMYVMKPLPAGDSLSLLSGIIFGSGGSCPKEMEKVAEKILVACGGIPLAIIIISGLLACKPAEVAEWELVSKRLEQEQAGKIDLATAERLRKIFQISYSDLPRYIKSCLLYLSAFEGDNVIRKDRLIWRWTAEGFLPKRSEESWWDTGERCFLELIARKLIKPVYDVEGDGCQVHGLVFDFITSLSKDENFVKLNAEASDRQLRQITVGSASVRSLTLLWCWSTVPDFSGFKFLRVLDLQGCTYLTDRHVVSIGGLLLLKYLGLKGTSVSVLPEGIAKLRHMETLDLRGTRIKETPPDIIIQLPKLASLLTDVGVQLPTETGKVQELQEISMVMVKDKSSLDVVADLLVQSKPRLRMLGVKFDFSFHRDVGSGSTSKERQQSVTSFLDGVGESNLQSLLLQSYPAGDSLQLLLDSWVQKSPPHLRRFELGIFGLLEGVPRGMAALVKLTHLHIRFEQVDEEHLRVLGALPNLLLLDLYSLSASRTRIIISSNGFQCLQALWFECSTMGLQFTAGAMPQLHTLQLSFMADTTKSKYPKFDFGVQHLYCLTQVVVKINCFKSSLPDVRQVEGAIRGQLCQNRNNPKLKLIREREDSFVKVQVQGSPTDKGKDVSQLNRGDTLTSSYFNTAADMVCASTGAMNSVLRKLAVLIGDEYAKKKLEGKHEEVMSLHEELGAMNALLEQLADMPELNKEMKALRNQMRDMTYDVEDCIDGLMLQFDEDIRQAIGYPEEWDELQDFIRQIRNLTGTAQAGKPDLPSTVHTSEIQTLLPSYKATQSGLHTLYDKAIGLVGIDDPRDLLVKGMNAGKRKQRLVVCILGYGGLGKTTLATEVYNHIKGPFDCRVFIQVPRNIHITSKGLITGLHKNILQQLLFQLQAPYARDMVKAVEIYLQDKRYLIVINGVRSVETWKVLESALPKNNRGSRILVTTDERDIAESCKKHSSYFIYCIEPLNPRDSLSLFRGLLFGSEKSGLMGLERVAKKILAACGGIPMAISIMAGILAGIPADEAEWEMVEKRMEPVAGDGDHAKEIIRKLFDISYSDLPRDIKCCLLYLSVFPDKHFIGKDRLIWRWIAEGFLPKTSEKSSWETGERYFQELVARNLIEPVYEDEKDDYEMPVGCKVHGLILEFITSLSNEENLVTTIGEATHVQHDVIRRFSASYMNQEEEDHVWRLISTQRLSKVRSITILEGDQRVDAPSLDCWGPLLLGSRFLRVLDLEDAKSLRDQNLEGTIGGLVLLRYLGLAGTGISQLPEEIGKVEQLETLDLRRNRRLMTLPASIGSFRKLVRLLVDPWVHLPSEISQMQELEQVSTIDADSSSSLNSVAELLVKSKPLRMLDVNFRTLYGHDEETTGSWRLETSIMSFLRVVGNSNLQSLSLCCGSQVGEDLLGILLNAWEVPPRGLRRFKLAFHIRGVVPPQMASLFNVTHLDIRIDELEAGGVRVLGDLPNLVLLNLTAEISTRCVISGEKTFRCLKVFTFRCFFPGGMGLEFTPGAMPQLQRLRLHFSARETLSLYGGFDFGIQHLSCLARVHATIDCKYATVSEVEGAEAAIRKQVSEFPIKPTVEFSRYFERMMRKDEGTKKTSLKQKARTMFSL